MPISDYLAGLRQHVGTDLLLVTGVLGLVRDSQDRFLIQLRSDTATWGFPGGSVDPGEAPAQAVVREVYEESGLIARPDRLIGVLGPIGATYPNGDRIEATVAVFVCSVVGGRLEARDDESADLRWAPRSEVLTMHHLRDVSADVIDSAGAWFSWDEAWLNVP